MNDRLWTEEIIRTGLRYPVLVDQFDTDMRSAKTETSKRGIFAAWLRVAKSLTEAFTVSPVLQEKLERGEVPDGYTDITEWTELYRRQVEDGQTPTLLQDWLESREAGS